MSGRITEMLKLLPDNPEVLHDQVWFIDFYAWDATLGLNLNDYKDSSGLPTIQSEITYKQDLVYSTMNANEREWSLWSPWLGQAPYISGMGRSMSDTLNTSGFILGNNIHKKFIGYGPLDVECSILSRAVYHNVPVEYEAITGKFDTADIKQAVNQYEEAYQRPQVSNSSGFDIYSWESETANYDRMLMLPVFDNSGRGRTIAVQPEYVFASQQPLRVDEMIETCQGRTPSLADDPQYRVLAEKLEAMDSMSAVISVDKILKYGNWPGKKTFFEKAASYAPLLGPYTACAAGLSVDDKGLFISLIILYESPYLAEKDIEVLKERLASGTNSMNTTWAKEVDDSEIWADGSILCAKLYGKAARYWDSFVFLEPLLARED
jgi:hypothetical protein